jgi:thiamine biosynthesis lipoprotein
MGTRFEVAVTSRDREFVPLAHSILNEIGRLEEILSFFREESSLCRMNKAAPGQWFRPDPDLWSILVKSLDYCMLTDGALDITIGSLWKLWGFHRKQGRVPSDFEIEESLENSGFRNIGIREETREVRFLKTGLEINLGGTGKGYALDRAASMMENKQAGGFLLNAGFSTFYAGGSMGSGEKGWKISVRNPRGESGADFAIVKLKDQALATSGAGRQFFENQGVRFGHIIDPGSGRPVDHFLSATAIADSALAADALSTAFFVMDIDEVKEFCERNREAGALLITGDESGTAAEYFRFGKAEELVEIV